MEAFRDLSGAGPRQLDRSRPRPGASERFAILLGMIFFLALAGCHQLSPSQLPSEEPWILAIKSARLPESRPWIARAAHHTWFDIKRGDEQHWLRIEVADVHDGVALFEIDALSARSDSRFDRDVHLIRHWSGPEAERMFRELEAFAESYEDDGNYRAFPGPNSNAFAARAMRSISGLSAVLHHNAVGKDYAEIVRVGGTTSGTGIALETMPLGAAVGVEEGLELHFLQLTLGLSLLPPALKLPLVPALGF